MKFCSQAYVGEEYSQLFPLGQRNQFVQNFLQSLEPTFMIRSGAGNLFAALHIKPVGFPDLRYFFPHLCDALFDRLLHGDRLTEQTDQSRKTQL
jgi:hypothetical protein